MTTVVDFRRPLDVGPGPLCAVIAVNDHGSTVTACRGRWPYTTTRVVVDPSLTIDDDDACGGCARVLRQSSFVDFAAGVPPFPTSLVATSFDGLSSLVDHELEQLKRKAAPAVDLEPMAGPTLPRTTAIDLPAFDVSDELATGSGE